MSALAKPRLAIFNPGLLERTQLERQFVARTQLLEQLLDGLRATPPNHQLLLGHRGMGKTTLLWRLRYAIEADAALSARWMPLNFPEEQYNISRLSDLWLNCLDALGDGLEQVGQGEEALRLDAVVDALPVDEARRAPEALGVLNAWMQEHRGLVLLIDNLDLVLERLSEQDQWEIRELMSSRDDLVIIGASSQPVDAMAEYKAPFYDFFRVRELKGLDEHEARSLMLALSEAQDTPQVAALLQRQPGRFRALHVLTGGNPRTLVLLYQVLALDDNDDVHVDLERLLDQCTPLYKDRFESLPAQAQQIVDGLALRWDPASAHDLAADLRLDVNKVSAQLSRLVKQGLVEKVPLPHSRRAGFQVAERFFNIWYLMRASRRVRRKLLWLVRFLELFYGEEELSGRAARLLSRAGSRRSAELALALARSASLTGSALGRALEHSALDVFARHRETRRRLRELLDLEGEDADLKDPVERRRVLREAERWVMEAEVDWEAVGCTAEAFWGLLGGDSYLEPPDKLELAKDLVEAAAEGLSDDELAELVETVEELQEDAAEEQAGFGEAASAIRAAVAEGIWTSFDDLTSTEDADAIELRTGDGSVALLARAVRLSEGEATPEEREYVRARHRDFLIPLAWLIWASELAREGGQEAAFKLLQDAVELEPDFVQGWAMLGRWRAQAGAWEEAVEALRRATYLDPDDADSHELLGVVMLCRLVEPDQAVASLREAVRVAPERANALAWLGRALLLSGQDWGEAEAHFRQALAVQPDNTYALNGLACLGLVGVVEVEEALAFSWRALVDAEDKPGVHGVHALLMATAGDHRGSLATLEQTWASCPQDASWGAELAHKFAKLDEWPQAASCSAPWLRDVEQSPLYGPRAGWPLFALAAGTGHAQDGLDMLTRAGLLDRHRPLAEALRAVDDPEHLLGVAPEVRVPAEALLERWEAMKPED